MAKIGGGGVVGTGRGRVDFRFFVGGKETGTEPAFIDGSGGARPETKAGVGG